MRPRVGMALVNRGWTAVAGLAIITAAPAFLHPAELGTYYAFNSLLALQIFFDLGFNYVVMQVAAHEAAQIEHDTDDRMVASMARDRAVSLARLLRRWYSIAALLFMVAAVVSGFCFFGTAATAGVHWQGPWIAVTALTAINLFNSPFLSIDEAFGHVHEVARLRLVCGVSGTALFVAGLAAGLHLWAVPLYIVPMAAGSVGWLRSSASVAPKLLAVILPPGAPVIDWRHEIFPFQWRLSLSWISGYFIYQLITPAIYRTSGPVAAAQYGLALSICNGFMGFGVAWMNATSPSLVKAIEDRRIDHLHALFAETLKRSSLALGVAFIGILALPYVSPLVWPKLATKLPSSLVVLMLASAMLANHVIYGLATYLRSFRAEVLTAASLTSAALTVLGVAVAVAFAPAFIPAAYCISICFVLLPWTLHLYRAKRRQVMLIRAS